jgi:hypothetical protein
MWVRRRAEGARRPRGVRLGALDRPRRARPERPFRPAPGGRLLDAFVLLPDIAAEGRTRAAGAAHFPPRSSLLGPYAPGRRTRASRGHKAAPRHLRLDCWEPLRCPPTALGRVRGAVSRPRMQNLPTDRPVTETGSFSSSIEQNLTISATPRTIGSFSIRPLPARPAAPPPNQPKTAARRAFHSGGAAVRRVSRDYGRSCFSRGKPPA